MPTTESARNSSIAPDRASLQLQSDNSSPKGKNKHRLASFAKRILNNSEQGESDERNGDGVLKKTFGSKKSTKRANGNRPSVPLKDDEPPMSPNYTPPDETDTPIYAELAKVKSELASGAEEVLDQTEQDNLLARIVFLEGLAEGYRKERDAASLDCSGLQSSLALLRGERDGFRDKHANLQTKCTKFDIDNGKLLQDIENLKFDNTKHQSEIVQLQRERDIAKSENARVNEECRKLEGEMEKKAKDTRQAKKTLEEERSRWARYDQVMDELKTKLQDQQAVLQLVKIERDKLKPFEGSYHELNATYKKTFANLDRCSAELLNTKQQYDDLQAKHSTASDELNRIKLESRSTLDDSFFIGKFHDLQGDIRQWADRYFWGPEKKLFKIQYPHEQTRILTDLLILSDDVKDLLMNSDSGLGRSLVCEAYLWKFIEEQIFDGKSTSYSKGMYWAHNVRSELCRIEKFLRPGRDWPDAERRMFYKWKASTVKLLVNRLRPPNNQSRIPVDPATLIHLSDRVIAILKPWITGDEHTCITDLETIIQSAINFDSHMNEQWSFMYAASTPVGYESRHGFPFESTLMEATKKDIQISAHEPVGIVVSPALVRAGTASGDNYDDRWVLVKSRVLPQGFSGRSQRPKNGKTTGMVTRSLQGRLN